MIKDGAIIEVDGREFYLGHDFFGLPIMVPHKDWKMYKVLTANGFFLKPSIMSFLFLFVISMVIFSVLNMPLIHEFIVSFFTLLMIHTIPAVVGVYIVGRERRFIVCGQYDLVNRALCINTPEVHRAIYDYVNYDFGSLIHAENTLEKIVSHGVRTNGKSL